MISEYSVNYFMIICLLNLLTFNMLKNSSLLKVSEGCRPYFTDYLKRILESILMCTSQKDNVTDRKVLEKCLYVVYS